MPDQRAAMAQRLATEFGLPIIFLRPGDKRPLRKGAFEAQATLDPAEIARRLGGRAQANYGLAWGERAGCFALDVDEGGDATIASLEFELGPLPATWRIITQSGNHQDIWRWPDDGGDPIRNRGRFAPGLDVRGAGGQSVGPLSEFVDRETGEVRHWAWAQGREPWSIPLADMPQPWLDRIRTHAERPAESPVHKPTPPTARNRVEAFAQRIIDDKLAALAAAPDGEQELRLGAAALKAGSLIARGWLSRVYAEQAIVATLLDAPNYDQGDPWTYSVATYKVSRAIERGLRSPEPDPPWLLEAERPVSHLKAISGGKANGGARPDPDQPYPEDMSRDAREPDDDWVRDFDHVPLTDIPTRQFLYGKHYIRRFVSCTIAPPGTGKSMLNLTEAVAMATGRPLLGVACQQMRVGVWNGEDPMDELRRRVAAICKYYEIDPRELQGWLFWGSGREHDLILATQGRDGSPQVDFGVVERIIRMIDRLRLDVLTIDPLVSSHRVNENNNMALDAVVKTWGRIADRCNCSAETAHHPRKPQNGDTTTVDDSRGAGALVAGVRSARVLNTMSKTEAEALGVEEIRRRAYFSEEIGKANLAPPEAKTWRRFISIDLENGLEGLGDNVGVIVPWQPPNPFDGVKATDTLRVQQAVAAGHWRENPQAADWVGKCVADVLGLDLDERRVVANIKMMLKRWFASGLLDTATKSDTTGHLRKFVVVGKWIKP